MFVSQPKNVNKLKLLKNSSVIVILLGKNLPADRYPFNISENNYWK